MWTIIQIGLGWLALAVLAAWVWHRVRINEYRAEYTEKEIWQDCGETNLDDTPEVGTDSVTFSGMGEAEKAMKERLESIFGQDDPDEASPEERRTGREIAEIAAMIVQEAGGKE